jgi:tetratricopeptide (TPR) repeat protein
VRAYRHELARQTGRLGKYLTGSANAEEANAAFARTQAILEQLVLEGPSDTFCRRDLAQHYMEQAKRHKSQSQNDQAEAAFQKALPIYEALAGPRATAAEIRVYGMALNELGIFYFHLDRYDETQPLYEKALKLREKLAAQNKNDAVYAVDLGGSYCNLGHLFQIGRKDTEEALKWYEKSVQTLQPLAAKNPTAKRYLFNAYQGRAESLFKLSRYAEAARDFDLGVGLGIEPGAVELRWRRALAWASAGEHAKAAKEAEELAAGKLSPKMLVDLAEIWSRAAEAAKSDSTLSESTRRKYWPP